MQLQVLIASRIKAINPTARKLMRLLKRSCLPPQHEFAVETALREALANAIVHGNHHDPSKKVRVRCGCDAVHGLWIAVRDEGAGFDPAVLESPVLGENLASDHGRGLLLIRRYMDEVRFEDRGREIFMRKSGSTSR